MLPISLLVGAALAYLLLLFLVAERVERERGRWVQSPWVYSLALGSLFTGWGYFGTGAALVNQGVTILASAIGASLIYLVGWPFALRAIRLAKRHHVSTLPGLLSVRYGHSPARSAALAGALLFCTLPYVTLQLEAIALAFNTLAHGTSETHPPESTLFVLIVTLVLALFACLFGARRSDPTTRHEGAVLAMAIDGVFKLAALATVVGWLFLQHRGLFATASPDILERLTRLGPPQNTLANWLGLLAIPFAADMLVPHMFHLAIVENAAPRQLALARWAFPLHYLLLFACVTLIALAGALLGLGPAEMSTAVLRLPMREGAAGITLFAYLGGISASACMAIMTLIALANIAVLEWWVPLAVRTGWRFEAHLRPLRWTTITALALGAWLLWLFARVGHLPQFGLLALSASAQFAPATLLGLVWRRPPARALGAGLAVGFGAWLYTAFLPIFAEVNPLIAHWVARGPGDIGWLKPHALFGLAGWDPYAHAIFWSLGLNAFVFLAVTLAARRDAAEEDRVHDLLAEEESLPHALTQALTPIHWEDLADFAGLYVGSERAKGELERVRRELEAGTSPEAQLLIARTAVERLVSGPLGAETARQLVHERWPIATRTLADVFGTYQELEETLALNREALTNRVRELSFLNAASERLVETSEPESLLRSIGDLLQDTFRLDLVGAVLWDGQNARLSGHHGFAHLPDGPLALPEGSPLAQCLTQRQARHVTASRPAEAALDPIVSAETPYELVYVPMATPERALGALVCGVTHSPVFLSSGFTDLLQALANELAVALAGAQLRMRSEEVRNQLEATLRNLADAVLVMDRDLRVRLHNEAMLRIIGTDDKDYMADKTLLDLVEAVQTQTLDGVLIQPLEYRHELATTRAMSGEPFNSTMRIRNLRGQDYILSISSMPILDAHGEVHQVVTVYRDVTELYALQKNLENRVAERTEELATERDRLKETNQKLEGVVNELRALEKLKGTFINAISHDLRIPLTGIVGYAEFIEDGIGGEPTAQQQEFARQIMALAERMTKLLNELLDFARMEAGKFKIEPRPISLLAPLEEAIQGFRPVFAKKGVALKTDFPAELPPLEADPDRLVQVLSNLLSNAIKFTPEGGGVTARARLEDGHARVEVEDTGVGIPPEALPHMFERFFQTEAGRRAGGTGIGLSICKVLVEGHGGSIGVSSVPGEGSVFWFRLPLSQPLGGADVVQ